MDIPETSNGKKTKGENNKPSEEPKSSQELKPCLESKSLQESKTFQESKQLQESEASQESKSSKKLNPPQESITSQESKPTRGLKSSQELKYPCDKFDDNDDLVASINYNTITSLAALKDILQGDGNDTLETDSFFHHYFMNHCNNLSSRTSSSPFPFPEKRRLSQCREEDEETDKKDKSPLSSIIPSKDEENEVSESESAGDAAKKRTVMGVSHKFLVTTAKPHPLTYLNQSHNAHTVHFGTKGVEEIRPNIKSIFDSTNLHKDKKYFDSSLIEIRSKVDDEVCPPTEDIWIKREIPKRVRTVRVSQPSSVPSPENQAKGSRPRRVSLDDAGRSRASSWSSRKDKSTPKKNGSDKKINKKNKSKDEDDGVFSWSTQSVRDKQKWGSNDDVETRYQQTIHGTTGVSRRPALFDIFKSNRRSDAKKQNLIQQMVEAVQNIGKSASKESNVEKKDGGKDATRDGSAHPHAGSDAKYYHTMTAGSQRRSSSAISKVVDIFRNRPSTNDAADKRKARAILQHSQQTAAGAKLLRDVERRRSLGHLSRQRSVESPFDPYRAALLVRDEKGVATVIPYLDKDSKLSLEEDEAQIFVKFFKYHTCYDLMPTSAKLVIFDTKLRVKKAFFALVDNGVRAAPLWDSENQKFVGMLTITDFIKILQMYYTSPDVTMDELEEHRLETWQAVLKNSVIPLVSISPKSSLLDAIKILIANKIHRLPVIDPETGDVIHILTHKRILRFLFLYINDIPKPAYLQRKIRDIRIGTLNDIEVATEDTLIIDALTKFVNRRVSALPIVDAEGRLKDIYAKFDVINLAAEKTYNNLNVTLKKANEYRNAWFEGVQRCTLNETLMEVMERLVKAEVHRLVVVDDDEKVTGIISLSDLLQYIALRPLEEGAQAAAQRAARATTSIDESEESTETLKEVHVENNLDSDDDTDVDTEPTEVTEVSQAETLKEEDITEF